MHMVKVILEILDGVARYGVFSGNSRWVLGGRALSHETRDDLYTYVRKSILGQNYLAPWDNISSKDRMRISAKWDEYTGDSPESAIRKHAPSHSFVALTYCDLIHVGIRMKSGERLQHLIQSDQMETFIHLKNDQKVYEFDNAEGRTLIYVKNSIEYIRFWDVSDDALNSNGYI